MSFQKISMQPIAAALLLAAFVNVSSSQTTGCSNPRPPDPSKTFLQNFLNVCYAYQAPLTVGNGQNASDRTESYSGFFYHVNSAYEIVIVGEFPQGRYLSITADDGHLSPQNSYSDAQLKPLNASYVNPFLPGVLYKEDQLYAVALQFGGSEPSPANISPGCGLGSANIHANVIDATKRHAGLSWNGDPIVPANFPPHDDVGPNLGGMVTVRQYLSQPDQGSLHLAAPVAIVRDLRTGCAVPIPNALATNPASVLPSQVITNVNSIATTWIDVPQINNHKSYHAMKPTYCYSLNPADPAVWFRSDDYIQNPNPDDDYLNGVIAPQTINWLLTNKGFMRFQFQVPSTPSIPCSGCALSGSEQLRYFDLSFVTDQAVTLATIGSPQLVTDPNGFVTLMVGFGADPPSTVTAANYYTYLDLSKISGFQNLKRVALRMVMPAPTFHCSATAVNFKTSEPNSLGGSMGQFAPVVDLLTGSNIPPSATPLSTADSCGLVPPELPTVCQSGTPYVAQ